MSVATIIERLTEKGEKFASGVYVGPNYSKADLLADLRAHEADLREALDALAVAHDVWMNAAPHHRIGERIKVKSILRKHGRDA